MICVTGAGGFIGGHLVKSLLDNGWQDVRAVDIKPLHEWHQLDTRARVMVADLRRREACEAAVDGCTTVYNLAADMGGMGFIENNKLDCMLSVLISTHMLQAAADAGVKRFFYSSSACVYPLGKQTDTNVSLAESDAYPADSEDGYGWEKLFTERMCRHFTEDRGMVTRVARFHNVYGPHGTWDGGREKAPAAICRKVAQAELSGELSIDIWGDGEQTRSFMYIDDCLNGIYRIMESDISFPLNLGSAELVSINELVSVVEDIAGVTVKRNYIDGPLGVRGRNSDNTLIKSLLAWEPSISLRYGMEKTYEWIYDEVKRGASSPN